MTSSDHATSSVTSPFDSVWPLSYRLPIVNKPLSPVVFEIFSVKKTDTDTHALYALQVGRSSVSPKYSAEIFGRISILFGVVFFSAACKIVYVCHHPITMSSLLHWDHQQTRGDPMDDNEPPGWEQLMRMFSLRTLGSIRIRRQKTGILGNKSSVWQRSSRS